jgi:hypothetical protein
MPQLDKVTLFSQVFWLLFLYFFFFLIFLKYFLPSFSKVFKIRSYYLFNKNSSEIISSKEVSQLFCFTPLLSKFEVQIRSNLTTLQDYCFSELNYYNSVFFKDLNKLFVLGFLRNCLKSSFFKKLYF